MQRLLGIATIVTYFIATGIGFADDVKTAEQKADQEIRKLLTEMETSFNSADAKGLSLCWTSDGDFIGQNGERIEGRDNIEKVFRDFLTARKDSKLKFLVLSTRMISDGVALVDAIPIVNPQTATRAREPGFQLVLVQRSGRWLIESARETVSRSSPQSQPLKELEWMIGDWADEPSAESGASLRSTCAWTENKNFLIRKFKVEGKSGVLHAGTEVIGWDPRGQRIRSWIFDTNGGFGENVWVRDGNRWLLRYSGTLSDGSEVSATNILTIVDANTVTHQSKDRLDDGESQPDVPAITVHRQAPASDGAKLETKEKAPRQVLP